MKKTLAIVLSLLVAFSMLTVMASATDGLVKVDFTYVTEKEATVVKTVEVAPGTSLASADFIPDIPTQFMRVVTDENGEEKEYKYTFKGWRLAEDEDAVNVYYNSSLPTATEADLANGICFVAVYSIEDYSERQSFWNFIESLFERINILFEYFATIFKF